MKYLLLTFVLAITLLSCTDNNNNVSNTTIEGNIVEQVDSNLISINTTLPFGCENISKIKYPKEWLNDPKHYGQIKLPEGKEYENLGLCYQQLNFVKTISSPKTEKLQIVKIGDFLEQSFSLDTLLQKSIDSCRYRLPNIGIYECYYSFRYDAKPNSFGAYGNLLLLDPKTKAGKILNLYFEGTGDSSVMSRYFLINNNNNIIVYEGWTYDDGSSLDEKYKITIQLNGDVEVIPI